MRKNANLSGGGIWSRLAGGSRYLCLILALALLLSLVLPGRRTLAGPKPKFKENMNFWMVIEGPDAFRIGKAIMEGQEELLEKFLAMYAYKPGGQNPEEYRYIDIAKARPEAPVHGEEFAYYPPYIANHYKYESEPVTETDPENPGAKLAKTYFAFQVRGYLDPKFMQDGVEFEVKLPEPAEDVNDACYQMQADMGVSLHHRVQDEETYWTYDGTTSFVLSFGKNLIEDGQTYRPQAVWSQRHRPKLKVQFVGGPPQAIELTLVRKGNVIQGYESVKKVAVKLENPKDVVEHNLFTIMYDLDAGERADLDYFRVHATNGDNLYDQRHAENLYELEAPDLAGFTKELSGDVKNGWILTYTAVEPDQPSQTEAVEPDQPGQTTAAIVNIVNKIYLPTEPSMPSQTEVQTTNQTSPTVPQAKLVVDQGIPATGEVRTGFYLGSISLLLAGLALLLVRKSSL